MKTNEIRILDYTEYPGPRYVSQGVDSGEEYYHTVLQEKFAESLKENAKLKVDLDATAGYAPSFIDEIFGNLVYDFEYDQIFGLLEVKSETEPDWIKLVFENILPKWKKKKDDKQPRKPEGF